MYHIPNFIYMITAIKEVDLTKFKNMKGTLFQLTTLNINFISHTSSLIYQQLNTHEYNTNFGNQILIHCDVYFYFDFYQLPCLLGKYYLRFFMPRKSEYFICYNRNTTKCERIEITMVIKNFMECSRKLFEPCRFYALRNIKMRNLLNQ